MSTPQRYILALTGPSGVGKSTISRLLTNVFSDLVSQTPILTTRHSKVGDAGEYRYVTREEFDQMIVTGKMAAYTHIPSSSEHRFYGYSADDIENIWSVGKLPIVITEMQLLQSLEKTYGRRTILSCGLLPPGHSKRHMLSCLLHRLRHRGRDTEEHISDRLKNAEKDLDFFSERVDLFDHMIVNEDLDQVLGSLKKWIPHLKS